MAEILAVKNGVTLPRDMAVAQAKNELENPPRRPMRRCVACHGGPRRPLARSLVWRPAVPRAGVQP
jgi:hypothetical protein